MQALSFRALLFPAFVLTSAFSVGADALSERPPASRPSEVCYFTTPNSGRLWGASPGATLNICVPAAVGQAAAGLVASLCPGANETRLALIQRGGLIESIGPSRGFVYEFTAYANGTPSLNLQVAADDANVLQSARAIGAPGDGCGR